MQNPGKRYQAVPALCIRGSSCQGPSFGPASFDQVRHQLLVRCDRLGRILVTSSGTIELEYDFFRAAQVAQSGIEDRHAYLGVREEVGVELFYGALDVLQIVDVHLRLQDDIHLLEVRQDKQGGDDVERHRKQTQQLEKILNSSKNSSAVTYMQLACQYQDVHAAISDPNEKVPPKPRARLGTRGFLSRRIVDVDASGNLQPFRKLSHRGEDGIGSMFSLGFHRV